MSKRIIKYLFPEFLLDLLKIFIRRINAIGKYSLLKKNKISYNLYENDSVCILANGPSLTDDIQASLSGKKVIVMNDFFKSKYKDTFNIVALCYAEPIDSPSFNIENVNDILKNTNSESYWLDISNSGIKKTNKFDAMHYIFPGYEPNIFFKKNIELSKMTLAYNTSAQMAIIVAIHMGFKKISLYGFDHDWLANPKFMKHFYSSEPDSTDEWGRFSYHEQIKTADRIWSIYYKINELCKKSGIKIVNKSRRLIS